MKGYRIGNLRLKNPYFLAPMAGINDIAFRILCKKAGAGMVYTGMINPLTKKELGLADKPAVQLFSSDERGIAEFIKKNEKNALLFDFNLGCPARTAEKRGFGSFFKGDMKTIENILKAMRESTKKPITIKLRKSDKALKIAELAEKYCDALCIHPRTNRQGYSGKADIAFAEELKKRVSIPLIYSGDVDEKNADELLKKFDFVMIGRKALGYPNIFAKLTGKKRVFGFDKYLKLALKYDLRFGHIKSQAINFTRFNEGSGKIRKQLAKTRNLDELKEVLGMK